MRDYAQLSPRFWTGETGKMLRGHLEAQIVACYLTSAPGSHMIGMYPLELPTLCHHTGLSLEGARKGLARLSEVGFMAFDELAELVWVFEMAYFQIARKLKRGDNRIRGVEKELENYRKSRFFNDFIRKYRKDFCLSVEPEEDHPSEGTRKGLPSQEQEQEQDQDQEKTPEGGQPEKAPAAPLTLVPPKPVPPLTPLLAYIAQEFPEAKADHENERAWGEAFPGVDLLAEAKNARRWELDNPKLIKTQKRRFLGNWFAKAQNGLRQAPNGAPRRGYVPLTGTSDRFKGLDDGDPLGLNLQPKAKDEKEPPRG